MKKIKSLNLKNDILSTCGKREYPQAVRLSLPAGRQVLVAASSLLMEGRSIRCQENKVPLQNRNCCHYLKSLFALDLGRIGTGHGFGRFSPEKIGTGIPEAVAQILSLFIGFITIAAGIWFAIKFIIGGFTWISAGGDPESLKNARQTIIDALIGIIIVVGGLAAISIIGTVLGFPILNIGALFKNMGITSSTP